jgi:hypothetical protein
MNGNVINDTLVTFNKAPFKAGKAKKKTSSLLGELWNVLLATEYTEVVDGRFARGFHRVGQIVRAAEVSKYANEDRIRKVFMRAPMTRPDGNVPLL